MADKNEFGVDVERNTVRGRSCPRCGGKIIPSNRAVYQGAGDAGTAYPLWECERCGYSEMSEAAKPVKGKH